MRFAKQCLLTIIGILRQVFVSSRYRWKKTLLKFVQNHKSAIKATNWRIVKGFSISPPQFWLAPVFPPTFWTLESPLGEKGAQFTGHPVTMGAPNDYRVAEKSQQCYKHFLKYTTFTSKVSQVRTWVAKLASCPGRHLTLLRPWLQYVCYHCSDSNALSTLAKSKFSLLRSK